MCMCKFVVCARACFFLVELRGSACDHAGGVRCLCVSVFVCVCVCVCLCVCVCVLVAFFGRAKGKCL